MATAKDRAAKKDKLPPPANAWPAGQSGNPNGRPTKYDPSMCERVVEWGEAGKSRAWIAAELGITKQTLNEWDKQHPLFSESLARAKVLEQKWWEEIGQKNLATQGFAQSMWSRSMAARFPDDWREKTDNTTTLEAGDSFATLLSKIATKSVFPGDDETE